MRYEFAPHRIDRRSSPDVELPVPQCIHPSRRGWRNRGVELYKELFGEADYQRYSREQFAIPIPADSAQTRRELVRVMRRLQIGLAVNGLKNGLRSTHMAGVGATGSVAVLRNPDLPETAFLTPGTTFPCRVRHSNAAFIDDAGVVPRGCALKFTSEATGGPLDLSFDSGAAGEVFFDLQNFADFMTARLKTTPTNWTAQREYMRRYPAAFVGSIETQREPPTSFADLMYSSKIAMEFRAKDGKRRFVKYRLLRPDLDSESGLLSDDRQKCAWNLARDPADDRPRDYLRQEFLTRVKQRGIEYLLQFQLWNWDDARDTHEVFSLVRMWDEVVNPWLDVARIHLDAPLAPEDTERTQMSITTHPSFLAVPDAHHPKDPRSVGWARVHVYPLHYWARRVRWGLFMSPKKPPDAYEMIDVGPGGKADPPSRSG